MSVFTPEQQAVLNGIGGASNGASGSTFDRLLRQESGGRQFDSAGNVITSSKGAIGIAQVMPATGPEAAKLAGLPWDAERFKKDPEYNKSLGRAYFDKQLSTFGDERLALAAYNAGPGAVARAIRLAERSGGDPLTYLPEETQKYVPAIMGSGFGVKSKGASSGWSKQPRYADPGFNKALEQEARLDAADESPVSTSVGRGFKNLTHSGGLFMDNLTGDAEGAAQRIKEKSEWDAANPAPRSSSEFVADWQKLAEDDYLGMLGSVVKNPGGALNQMVEQTPNSLPALALQIPVGIASSALYATGWGAPIAMGLQGLAAFVGNVLPEGGGYIEEQLSKAGINPQDTTAVAKWIAENRDKNIEGGLKKAGVISLVDGATGYLGGKLIAGPAIKFAKAEEAVLRGAGVNLTDKAAVAAARATPAYKQAMAAPAQELLSATTRAQKTVRELGGFGLEAAGEGVGEYGGTYAANGDASVKDAVLESLMGAGTSAAMTGGNMALGAFKGPDASRAVLQELAATPQPQAAPQSAPQPTPQPNSPLSNAAAAGNAHPSSIAAQQQVLAEQESVAQPAVSPEVAQQKQREAIMRQALANQKREATQDYSAADEAESEIAGATGVAEQDRILELNRLVAEEQADLAEQRGNLAEAQRIRETERQHREAVQASRARNAVGAPSGSFGQMNEFADLMRQEQDDVQTQRNAIAEQQATAKRNDALRAESELQAADARVAAQMAKESAQRRRTILDAILADPETANPAARLSAELTRQGFRDTQPSADELAAIQRFEDIKAAQPEPEVIPSAPNEMEVYQAPVQRAPTPRPAPKQEAKPKQPPARRLSPMEIRAYVEAGAVLNGDTLTLKDGTTIKLKGPQIAAARQATSRIAPAQQVESTPAKASESKGVEQEAAPQEVESGPEVSANPESFDVSSRSDDQLRYLAENGKPGWNEAAKFELAKREQQKPEGEERSELIHDGVRIYPIALKAGGERKDMWAVESAENKVKREAGERYGFGDSLYDTLDQARRAADRQIKEDEASAKVERSRIEQEVADQAAEAARNADTYNGFLDGKAENTKELIRKALEKQYRIDGVVMTVRKRIESLFSSGELDPSSFEEPKIKPMSRTQFNRASQREQDAHEKKMREAGNKTVYTINGYELGKYAHDYAQHLKARGLRGDVAPEVRTPIDAAAHEAATSPLNDTPQPTDRQKEAGNYKVGRVKIQGMDISIENPQGSTRSGVSPDGVRWESTMANHYGYFPGTTASDGDHLDVFLTDGAEDAPVAWVIDQKNQDGSFDEQKIVLGPRTEEEARAAYLANYEPGWDGLGAISSMPIEAFKAWAFDGKKKRKPLAYVEPEKEEAKPADPREEYANQKEQAYIAKRGGSAPPKAVEAVKDGKWYVIDPATGMLLNKSGLPTKVAALTAAKAKVKGHEDALRKVVADPTKAMPQSTLEAQWLKWAEEKEGRKLGEDETPLSTSLNAKEGAKEEAQPEPNETEDQADAVANEAEQKSITPDPALSDIFAGLSSRGLAKTRAEKAAAAHPRAEQIAYVQENFMDILAELEDAGIVKINCD